MINLTCCHWSDSSLHDAQQLAQAKIQTIASKMFTDQILNRYPYGERPLREEIVQSIRNDKKKEVGIITRNSYGSLVLNAEEAMFIDIDFKQNNFIQSLVNAFRKLLGKNPVTEETAVVRHIEQWATGYPDLESEFTEHLGGIRCLVTNQVFDPTRESTLDILKNLRSDPLYIKLCKDQRCFGRVLPPNPGDVVSPNLPCGSRSATGNKRQLSAGGRKNTRPQRHSMPFAD